MSARYAFPPEWVAAIREDSGSLWGDIAREHAGIKHKISSLSRVTLRVGRVYPTPLRTQPLRDNRCFQPDYVKHPPICQACGIRIGHGEKAIRVNYRKNGRGMGRTRYIHEAACPKENA